MNLEMRLFHGPTDWGWVKQYLPLLRVEDTCGMTAVDLDTNATVGMVIFDNFMYNSAQAHIVLASPMVLKYGFLEEAFDLVFEGFGKDYLYGFVREDNHKALKLNKHLGFKETARVKEGYGPGCDYIMMELHKDNCTMYNQQIQEVA